jgi:hypothetical protein
LRSTNRWLNLIDKWLRWIGGDRWMLEVAGRIDGRLRSLD